MQKQECRVLGAASSVVLLAVAALFSQATMPSSQAQTAPGQQSPGVQAIELNHEPRAGNAGRIAKFVTKTELGNSALFQKGGLIGLGTTNPVSKLDIRAQDAVNIRGNQPFITLRDSSATGNPRHIIQSVDGGLNLLSDSYINGDNPHAFVRVDKNGNVGIGTAAPLRALQIGPSLDAAFTLEPSDASPRAGFIRFGDNTGWQLRIGRQREFSGGPLNTGLTGTIVSIHDNGAFHLNGFPLGPTGVGPLCRTLSNAITPCQSSSLRYKTDIAPYHGGLDVVNRLRPIAFTRKHNGASDIGLGAEDVAAVEPRFIFRNEKNEIEGVRYELLSAVFINAIKQQQEQIRRQQQTIDELQSAIARLEQASRR